MSFIPSYKKPGGGGGGVPSWGTGTDEEIVAALEAHYAGDINLYDYWSIGDERVIHLSAIPADYGIAESHVAQDVTFVLSEIGGKYLSDGVTECIFQVDQKEYLNETGMMDNDTSYDTWQTVERRHSWCNLNLAYPNAIPSTIRPIFKEFINQTARGTKSQIINTTDYFALRSEIEVFGSITYSKSGEGSQIEYYKTASNRYKYKTIDSTVNSSWWLRSPISGYTGTFCKVFNGNVNYEGASENNGIAPFGVI